MNSSVDPKDPTAILDYGFDFTKLLNGDTITTYTIDPDGLTKVRDSSDGKKVTAWFGGGVAGNSYCPRCTITTAGGRTDVRTMMIRVQNT